MKRAAGWIPVLLIALPVWATAYEPTIEQINEEAGGSWTARENDFSRLAPEQKKARLGLVPRGGPPVYPAQSSTMVSALVALPDAFDWRNNGGNFVTPVRNQGECGGCWAFSTAAVLESKVLIAENTPGSSLNLSEQVILACSGAGNCFNGGDITEAASFIKSTGTAAESCYPYTQQDGYCSSACANWRDSAFRVRGFSEDYYINPDVNDPNRGTRENLIKSLVSAKGPVSVAFTVYSDFNFYSGGVYRKTASAAFRGYHAVAVVGWKDTSDSYGGYFIVKNSWGTGWGESGFFKVGYDQFTSGPSGANFGWWIVSLGEAYRTQPLADLQCPDIFVSSSPVLLGDACFVQGNIRNAGQADAPATTARLYLSTDNDLDLTDDIYVDTLPVDPLAVGGESLLQWDFSAPDPGVTPQQIWPIVVVDAGNAVTESDEANAWKASSPLLTVEPPAWVQVTKPNGGNKWYRGKTYAFTWGASNCSTVKVELRKRVSGVWKVKKTIRTGVDATLGTLSWKVGKYFPTGSYYKARVTCEDDGTLVDESDSRFSIK